MNKRILHSMLRVCDLEKSIEFYVNVLGMKVLRSFENKEFEYTLVFIGYADEHASTVIELTYNHGTTEYEHGNAYGHIAIGVEDCYQFCEHAEMKGGNITRAPGPLKGGDEVIAFIKDPDGYLIEVVERPANWLSS